MYGNGFVITMLTNYEVDSNHSETYGHARKYQFTQTSDIYVQCPASVLDSGRGP